MRKEKGRGRWREVRKNQRKTKRERDGREKERKANEAGGNKV